MGEIFKNDCHFLMQNVKTETLHNCQDRINNNYKKRRYTCIYKGIYTKEVGRDDFNSDSKTNKRNKGMMFLWVQMYKQIQY